MKIPSREQVARLRDQYVGKRIRLLKMGNDPQPVPPNSEGVIDHVDDGGTLHMKWECGRTLGLIVGEDSFVVLD